MPPKVMSFRKAFCLAGCLFFFTVLAHGEEAKENFPFTGQVTADNVNVRAGQNVAFEQLGKLNKGQEVIVIGKSYGWYKIKLSDSMECYISERFVRLRFDDIGMVVANRVNLRAAASDKASVIGQLGQGIRVKIKGRTPGWYKIESPEGSHGWVIDKFIVLKSREIPLPKIVVEPSRNIYTKKIEAAQTNIEEKKKSALLTVIGRIEDLGRVVPPKDIRFKLIVNDKTIYYLEGDSDFLSSALHYTVKVEGTLKPDSEKRYKYPVIVVSQINSLVGQ